MIVKERTHEHTLNQPIIRNLHQQLSNPIPSPDQQLSDLAESWVDDIDREQRQRPDRLHVLGRGIAHLSQRRMKDMVGEGGVSE